MNGKFQRTVACACVLSMMVLAVVGCKKQEETVDETTAEVEETTEQQKENGKIFGGISIVEITEIAYHGEELRTSAEKIATKLEEMGASEIKLIEGTPSGDGYAVELGCEENDNRLMELDENSAIVSTYMGRILAAVKSDVFSHELAANMLYEFICDAKHTDSFTKTVKLHDAKAVELENGVTVKQFDKLPATAVSKPHFAGTTKLDATKYQVGEIMEFEISFKNAFEITGCPQFFYELRADDGKNISGLVDGKSGTISISTVMTTPGFVHLKVSPAFDDGSIIPDTDIYEGGACAAIEKIEQNLEEPEDFDEFWSAQKARLDEIGLEVAYKTEMPAANGYVAYDIGIKCVDGTVATGVLTMPKNATAKGLGAKIIYYGYGKASAVSPVYGTNKIVLAVNNHGIKNYDQSDAYYKEAAEKYDGFGFDTATNKDPNTSAFLNMMLRDIQAARYIMSMPEYNGEGIYLTGGSMGGMQAVCVAAQIGSENVSYLELTYPWCSDFGGAMLGKLPSRWVPEILDENGELVSGLLYFDPVNHAKRVTCDVSLSSCLGDYIVQPSGQVVLFKAFASENKTFKFRQNATHSYSSPEDESYEVIF